MAYSITTKDVSAITPYSANSGGNSIDASGAIILSKGVTWKVGVGNPTIEADFGQLYPDTSTSNFDVSLNFVLNPSTHYSLRAFLETNYPRQNIPYIGLSFADMSTMIIDVNGFLAGVDVSVGKFTGNIKYTPWTANPSTLIVIDGLINGIDVSAFGPGNFSGTVQYTTQSLGFGSFEVVNGLIGTPFYNVAYGATKEFNTLQLSPEYNPICRDCYWFNRHLNPTTGQITTLSKGDGSIWTCGAFNSDSSLKTIFIDILQGLNPHDVSIAGQLYDSWDDFYPVYDKVIPEIEQPIVDYLEAGTLPQISKYIGNILDVSTYPAIVPGNGYLKIPALIEGTNVTFDYGFLDLSSGGSYIDTITVNATGTLGVTKTYVDGSLGLRDASIIDLYSKIGVGKDPSTELLWKWNLSQDSSITILRSKDASQDSSIGLLNNWEISQDASIVALRTKDIQIDASIVRIDASLNNTLDASTLFQPLLQLATKTGTTAGNRGQWSFDASYLYICTSTNIWRRTLLSAF